MRSLIAALAVVFTLALLGTAPAEAGNKHPRVYIRLINPHPTPARFLIIYQRPNRSVVRRTYSVAASSPRAIGKKAVRRGPIIRAYSVRSNGTKQRIKAVRVPRKFSGRTIGFRAVSPYRIAPPAPPAPPAPVYPPGSFGNGTWLVGSEIAPGTYFSEASADGCYWERLSGLSGTFDDVITNEFTYDRTYVTIEPTDVAFLSEDCSRWLPVG